MQNVRLRVTWLVSGKVMRLFRASAVSRSAPCVSNSCVRLEPAEAIPAEKGRGRTIEPGQRGIWWKPLKPGSTLSIPYAMEVIDVPTTNFQLR